jgi:hypothetical protein
LKLMYGIVQPTVRVVLYHNLIDIYSAKATHLKRTFTPTVRVIPSFILSLSLSLSHYFHLTLS